ncbi:MAG TPA: S8 family serine peptidase [Pseudonocardiaceae bacterium]|nr:S8 family serine peptidase [Pseudonocardiaceae bacterium]
MINFPGEYGAGQFSGANGAMSEHSEPTGRYVVVFADNVLGDESASTAALQSIAGVSNVLSARDFRDGGINIEEARDADATLFPTIGVAVVAGDPDRLASLTAAVGGDDRIEAVEPERILHALSQPGMLAADYLRGYRDAAVELYQHANGGSNGAGTAVDVAAQFVDTPAFTWGLQATKVATSGRTGQGVGVAILDTGFDLRHPDFVGRRITSKSFVPKQAPQDGHGHGTHCTGASSGPQRPPGGSRRYGIAFNDNIFIGKVLSDQGSGADGGILAGIEWALTNRCRVISMSLGADIHQVNPVYEKVGQRALAGGCLIIAAAGNNARRSQGNFGFVGVPANSQSIMAVGAVDAQLSIANFSVRSNPVTGGQVDIVGPGVAVYSSWSTTSSSPGRYNTISGTSMATPHVAGIAALHSEATGATGSALWGQLVRTAQQLPLPSVDVGAGLVQAPQ